MNILPEKHHLAIAPRYDADYLRNGRAWPRQWCYCAAYHKKRGKFGLGIAQAHKRGCHPLPLFWVSFLDRDSALRGAEHANKTYLKLTDDEVFGIKAASINKGRV